MRSSHGHYSEYHTSADNLNFVQPQYLADSFSKCLSALNIIENNKPYLNQNPKCEPRLGKIIPINRRSGRRTSNELALLWVLNLSDGEHTLLTLQINQILVLMQSKGSRCPVKTRFIEIKPEGALVEGKMNYLGQLSGERILITGASGFLGSHVCDRLCKTVQKCMVFLETHQ